ncbi:FAD-dependent oxidoreductase [Paenibacillus xerothermodurans]|uniref:FAD-dependent oxidoreductase n=1 Tax=Paenibacillus xerothermodurans TaxID=1977292 RepID=A0A2W1N5A9_PAEXE|nr:FAD-dependent oxidoreductase [Paenibacillus xerothermodurans]PZE19567.1 FAD-dependent oxidoreductase [Paenibacillus xerothermodurans]
MTHKDAIPAALPQVSESYWLASSNFPSFPKLTHDITVDAAVVGGGISGITTAYLLTKQGLKVALVEAGRLMHGTTGHTTAKITAQHDLIYNELISHFGAEQARLYYDANHEAIEFIKQTINEHRIECDFAEQHAHVYTGSDDSIDKLQAEFKAYEQLGIPGDYLDDTPLPFTTKAAVRMRDQAQFNPIKFLQPLVRYIAEHGGLIFEYTTAETLEKGTPAKITTNHGHKIACTYAVSCSHFPFYGAGGYYHMRMFPSRSYALGVLAKSEFPGGMYISADDPKRSLRSAVLDGEDMLIIGGEGHQTGQGGCTMKHYEALQQFGEETFGLRGIRYRWSAQDFFTLDRLPYIGHVTSEERKVMVATGFKKWGMTTGVLSALMNVQLIMGEANRYTDLFAPSRFHADPSVKTFITENADVVKHYITGKLEMVQKTPEQLLNDEGAAVRVNGQRAGAYRDAQGRLHLVDTTCTHMKCELQWNAGERSWDCPCHGSRFTYQGEVIEGPAKKRLGKVHYP